MSKKLISIVIPLYNEEEVIEECYSELTSELDKLEGFDFEFIFMDNCSEDQSYKKLEGIASKDPRVKGISLSKNFGYQRSIWTGYKYTQGDAAIVFDCDLQDPPELLREFIEFWEQGYKIVYGIRKERKEGLVINNIRRLFYKVISKISKDPLPRDVGDFMLLDREILDLIKKVENPKIYIIGLVFTFGYKGYGIEYARASRTTGVSKFKSKELIKIATDGITSQSTVPLRLSLFVGIFIVFLSLVMIIGYLILKISTGNSLPAGFTTLVILLLISISLNAIFLGILGEYISRMYEILLKPPMSIVEKTINFSEKEESD